MTSTTTTKPGSMRAANELERRLTALKFNRLMSPAEMALVIERETGAAEILDVLADVLEVLEYGRTHTAPQFKHFLFGRYGDFTHASLEKAKATIVKFRGAQ